MAYAPLNTPVTLPVGDTFALRTFLGAVEVGIYFCFFCSGVVTCATSSLSGANTIKVTPNIVSARVVKIVN